MILGARPRHHAGFLDKVTEGLGKTGLDQDQAVLSPPRLISSVVDHGLRSLVLRNEQRVAGAKVPYLPDRPSMADDPNNDGGIIASFSAFFEIEERRPDVRDLR